MFSLEEIQGCIVKTPWKLKQSVRTWMTSLSPEVGQTPVVTHQGLGKTF